MRDDWAQRFAVGLGFCFVKSKLGSPDGGDDLGTGASNLVDVRVVSGVDGKDGQC